MIAAYEEHIQEPGFCTPPAMEFVCIVEQDDVVIAELTGEVTSDAGELARLAMAEALSCAVPRSPSVGGRVAARRDPR